MKYDHDMIMIDPSSLSMEDMQKTFTSEPPTHSFRVHRLQLQFAPGCLAAGSWIAPRWKTIWRIWGFGFLLQRNRNAETHQFSPNVTGFLMFFAWNSPFLTNFRVGSDWKLPIGSPNAPQTSELSSCTSAFKRASGVRNWLALAPCASNFSRKVEKRNLSDNSVKGEL